MTVPAGKKHRDGTVPSCKKDRKISKKMGQNLNLPYFRIISNIFAKLIFALKFNIWVLTQPNNMHKNFDKVIITG